MSGRSAYPRRAFVFFAALALLAFAPSRDGARGAESGSARGSAPVSARGSAPGLRLLRYDTQSIALPSLSPRGLPREFETTVMRDGREVRLRLRAHRVRAEGFRFRIQELGGKIREAEPPPERTYRGTVEGEAGTLVAATLREEGLHATVVPRAGRSWCVRPLRDLGIAGAAGEHAVHDEEDLILPDLSHDAILPPPAMIEGWSEGSASTEEAAGGAASEAAGGAAGEAGGTDEPFGGGAAGSCSFRATDIAFDSDYEFFAGEGQGDPEAAAALIEEGLESTNLIYERDAAITHRLSSILIRTDPATDFYSSFADASDFGAMLVAFREEWNANHGDVVRDMAYYVTGKDNPQYGGLAYVTVVCSNYAYGMGLGYWGYAGILRHELGHNWSCGHDCGLERRYIMCGNSIDAFSAFNARKMIAYSRSRACIDDIAMDTLDAEPFVRPALAQTVEGTGPIEIDVLSGITDRNCEPANLLPDARSAFGAEVRLVASSEPGSAARLLYSPRTALAGIDTIRFRVTDTTGLDTEGIARVEVLPRDLAAWWRLDEIDGNSASDASGHGHDATLEGGLSFATHRVTGRFGGALLFPGTSDAVLTLEHDPELDLTRAITVSAWFTADAFVGDGESLVSKGGDSWRLKRNGSTRTLKFTCTGLAGGEVLGTRAVDDGAWHHAAGVYDGSRLSLYLDGVLDRSVAAVGRIHSNTSSVRLGENAWKGAIDEVRLHARALSAEEVAILFAGGAAENPVPRDQGDAIAPGARLEWLAAPGATAHEVYLGEDRERVRSATRASAEYRASVTLPNHAPALEPGKRYYWRVDEVTGEDTRPGAVWSFQTAIAFTRFDEAPLNASTWRPPAGAAELGFQTAWTASGGQDPFAGIIETSSTPATPVFSHRSVRATTTFDAVAVSPGIAVAVDLQTRDSGYEAGDLLHVRVASGAESIPLIRFEGSPALDQIADEGYGTHAALLPEDWTEASLSIETYSNSSAGEERFDFDTVRFFPQAPDRVLAATRFEEATAGAASHEPGPGATELGFATTWSPTSGAQPLAGVVEVGSPVAAKVLSHRSSAATTTFAEVDLRGAAEARVSAVLRVRPTSYEADDTLEVYVTDGTRRLDLVRVNGGSGLGELADEESLSFTTRLPADWTRASLVFASRTNSSEASERVDLAAVEFLAAPLDGETRPTFRRGDANGDGVVDLSDGVRILLVLFSGGETYPCADAADTDDGGAIDISDGIRIFSFLFLGATPPAAPGPDACGVDPSEDTLECGDSGPCG